MTDLRFDRFYDYEELTRILESLASRHSSLCTIESIGTSHEGRDIWLATLTNTASGPHHEKPALWLDANIHSIEVTGCTAALHLVHKLLSGYGDERDVTRALDTRTFYIVPRLNPDGAEIALSDQPRYIRSSVRPYPRTDQLDGLHEEDVDGDGRILLMRIPDPHGSWKTHDREPRLMVPREPTETSEDGTFYRLLPEGSIRNYDDVTIKVVEPLEGLDLNRNFPMEWTTENEQKGAGPYPASEPEVRALMQAVVDRPNITGYITYHTFSGVHLRPYSGHADEHFPANDLAVFKLIGAKATGITGYPAVSVFHDFKYEPKQVIKGGADDWAYEHLGLFSWTTEFWSPQRQAGLRDYHLIEWLKDHPVEDDLTMLAWNDEALSGKGYVDWYPYEHPQLGKVELGGWDFMYCWTNPPPEFLEAEIAPHSDFAVWHALISPKLEITSLEAEAIGGGSFKVRLVVSNTGWLPSNVTEKAEERKVTRPVEAEVTVPDGVTLVAGERKTELGQLTGRALKRSMLWWGSEDSTTERAKAEWVVHAPSGGDVEVVARHQRAGVVRSVIRLD
ncbi:MAG: M14 family metallopeptidase [Actinomycetota bacterium]